MQVSPAPSARPARTAWQCAVGLSLCAVFFSATVFAGSSSASWFDSPIVAGCKAAGGEAEGCSCVETLIHDTFDAAYIPIIEKHVRGKRTNEDIEALGLLGQTKFGAELYQFTGTAAYQCEGARQFITIITVVTPW